MEHGTAKAGEDYRAVTNGRLTIRPGDRMGMLRVRLLEDRRVEPVETFRVRLTDAKNADVETARSRALGVAGRRSVRFGAAPEHEGLLYGRLHW